MSLLLWLPLNKNNLKSKGFYDATFTAASNTAYDSTELCYSFTDTTGNGIYRTSAVNTFMNTYINHHSWTLAGWCKTSTTESKPLIALTYGLILYVGRTADTKILLYNTKGSLQCLANTAVNDNKWHHIAATYNVNNNKVCIYVDGLLKNTMTYTKADDYYSSWTNGIYVGRDPNSSGSRYQYSGKARDIRVYDHELSAKEIAELSRGLFIHYKLNDWQVALSKCSNITWNQIISNLNTGTSVVTYNGNLPDERKWTVKSNISSTNRCVYTVGTTAPETHKVLVDITFKSDFTFEHRPYLRYAKKSGTYASLLPTNYVPGEWCKIKGIITGFMPSSASGILPYDNGYVEGAYFSLPKEGGWQIYDLTLMFGEGNEPTYDEFKLMFPGNNYPYNTGTVMDLTEPISDSAGYEYNGDITGILSLNNNTARYDKSTLFGAESYISLPLIPAGVIQSASFWFYIGASIPDKKILFVDYNSKIAFGIWNNYLMITACNGLCNCVCWTTDIKLSSWNHICIVRVADSTGPIVYINGINQVFLGINDNWGLKAEECTIGRRASNTTNPYPFSEKISDFRLYTKALTEDDIKDIITQATLDNKGNLFTYEFVENSSLNITSTGIIHTLNIIEDTLTDKQASFKNDKSIVINSIFEK